MGAVEFIKKTTRGRVVLRDEFTDTRRMIGGLRTPEFVAPMYGIPICWRSAIPRSSKADDRVRERTLVDNVLSDVGR